jgi:hypothetical protein
MASYSSRPSPLKDVEVDGYMITNARYMTEEAKSYGEAWNGEHYYPPRLRP